jgi:hypothetical protein
MLVRCTFCTAIFLLTKLIVPVLQKTVILIFHPATSFTSGKCLIIHEFRTQVGDINNE